MQKFVKDTKNKIGMAPGTLIHVGKINNNIKIYNMEYNKEYLYKAYEDNIYKCFEKANEDTVKWIKISGIDADIIEDIGERFKLHPLLMEDILHTGQRPKVDDYDNCMFIVLKLLSYDRKKNELSSTQVSLVLVDNYIFSFEEFESEIFSPIIRRIDVGKGNIRRAANDYLAYCLIDSIVDSYFSILEQIGEKMDEIEEELMDDPDKKVLQEIYSLKREMIFLRNSIWPLREVLNTLVRCESPIINGETGIFFRDVYDHTIHVIDTIENYRDMIAGMLDTYLSSISNKTNEVMKILTIFSTIFIPLTFLAGIYGMNFKDIPELNLQWGYEIFWIVSIIIIAMMIRFFKKKKWL